ncbi:MAG: hypothetical protein QXD23_00160 [Candidatus Micrarchaeaceae archaeon]
MNKKEELEDLFNKIELEKKTRELLPLPVDFYKKKQINNLTEKIIENENLKEENLDKNIEKLINNIKKIRIQKILLYIAYEKRIPMPIPKEEENLYICIKDIISSPSSNIKNNKIKIINNTPELITPEGNKIGPFRKGQYINIQEIENQNEIDFILNNKIGEII